MNRLLAIWDLFKVGNSVIDPQKWKSRQITATILSAVILAIVNLAATFGYALPINVDTANAIAAGVIAVVNVILTVTTSDKVGLKPSESSSVELEAFEVGHTIIEDTTTQQKAITQGEQHKENKNPIVDRFGDLCQ